MKYQVLALLLALWIPACQNSVPENSSETKIIGGIQAGTHPFMAGLLIGDFGRVACGGALIQKNVVITAAHCVQEEKDTIRVLLGTNDAKDSNPTVKVKGIISHPDYDAEGGLLNDIAVLILEDYDPKQFGGPVGTIPLSRDDEAPETLGQSTVIGWGNTSSHGVLFADQLRQATIPTISIEECQSHYSGVNNTQICAGLAQTGGLDSCQGDSGGPLVVQTNGNPHLAGVVSWGEGCAQKEKPGVYTRVSKFATWIETSVARHTRPESFSGKNLQMLMESHCLLPFMTTDVQNGEMGTTISLGQSYKPATGFYAIEDQTDSGFQAIGESCEFTTNEQRVSIELQTNQAGLSRFIAKVGDKILRAGAQAKTDLVLMCAEEATNQAPMTVVYSEGKDYQFAEVDGTQYFLLDMYEGDLSRMVETTHCSAGSHRASLMTKPNELGSEFSAEKVMVLEGPAIRGGLLVLSAQEAREEESGVTMTLDSDTPEVTRLTLNNQSGTDIFTWELSCNQKLVLTDGFGVTYYPFTKGDRYIQHFVMPAHKWGAFFHESSVSFNILNPEPTLDRQQLDCQINGMPITLQ
jgi:trypsin